MNVSRGGMNEKRGGAVRERDIIGFDSSATEREESDVQKEMQERDTSRADSPQSAAV